jgi:DNA polymerase-3 subunit epsilon
MLTLDEYIILDIKTTGCRPLYDRIIEIGLQHIKNNQILQTWHTLINPEISIPVFIQHLTEITNEKVSAAPLYTEIADDLYQILQGKILVAHNARFDYSFLKNEFNRCGYLYRTKTLCTVKLARHLFPNENKHNLDAIIQKFNIKTSIRHRALADIAILQQFLTHITNLFSKNEISAAIKICLSNPSLTTHITPSYLKKIPNTNAFFYRRAIHTLCCKAIGNWRTVIGIDSSFIGFISRNAACSCLASVH